MYIILNRICSTPTYGIFHWEFTILVKVKNSLHVETIISTILEFTFKGEVVPVLN
jgi:hypothetical protein